VSILQIAIRIPRAADLAQWPWRVRALLGCVVALLAEALTWWIAPLRAFPLLLPFPAIVLSAWFLGMWGGAACALVAAILLNLLLSHAVFRFLDTNGLDDVRIAAFLGLSIFLSWTIRRLAQQREQLRVQELQQSLMQAQNERQIAEARARISETFRERDEMLQMALESNGMGLWISDIEQGTFYCSDQLYRIAGREPDGMALSYEEWLKIIHPDDLPGVMETTARSETSGKNYHQQYRINLPDGSLRWVESQGILQRDSAGRMARVVGVMADITNRKLTEEAMLRTEKLAIAGRLAASVAHEINNPLEAISNLLYLITLDEHSEPARGYARQALDEVMRVSQIAQQTLKFHRQTGAPAETQLSEVVTAVLALFAGRLHTARVEVDLRVEREVSVTCMPSEMQQVFANLLSNAIDAMLCGGRLAIRLRPSRDWRDGRTEGVRVTFRDSGAGMDRATLRRIYEPFFTTKTETGTGLGMWVVAQLVERHHGQVRAWSSRRPGASGTAFSVFLPLGAPTQPPTG